MRANRAGYNAKFDALVPMLADVLDVRQPDGGFFLWIDVGMDDVAYATELYESQNVVVLPGSFLSRDTGGRPHRARVTCGCRWSAAWMNALKPPGASSNLAAADSSGRQQGLRR